MNSNSDFIFRMNPEKASCIQDYTFIKESKHFFCPICETALDYGGLKRLETLEEHVGDPNGQPSLKISLICPNKYCPAHIIKCLWDTSGGFYSGIYFIDYKYLNFKDDIHSALGSWQREYDLEKKKEEQRTFKLRLGKYDRCYYYLQLDFYLPNNPLHWSLTIWHKGRWRCVIGSISDKVNNLIEPIRRFFKASKMLKGIAPPVHPNCNCINSTQIEKKKENKK